MIQPTQYDAVIIGGGPAGSTVGALLAEMGHCVAILEKEKFPRYHIGESLIPFCYFTLDRLGLVDKLNASSFVKKYSVQFVSPDGKLSAPFYFSKHMDHPCSQSWQVVRDEFDRMLLDNAREKKAQVLMETQAISFIEDGERIAGVIARGPDGAERPLHAKMVVDCSGRDIFSIRKYNWRVQDPSLNKMAVWTYYEGAKRDEGIDEGTTTVAYIPQKGWFWYIPLPNDMVSVGIVAEPSYLYRDGRDPKKMFEREIENNPWVAEYLAPGKQVGEYKITSDYSYRSKYSARDGLVLCGDAFSFLDPVFSSGVFLALKSGELAADAIHNALEQNDTRAEQFEDYSEKFRSGIEAMRKLVYAFYAEDFSFKDVLMKYPHHRADLTDCLIGNVDKDFGALFEAVSEFAEIPTPLPHGRPLVAVS
ncbi:MAG: tryptophan 7-halogenase [Candidatus Omnitrophica bacterium]|nr:tryptophan 7-halogenase [Candidatus Omnitrophota bacterium]